MVRRLYQRIVDAARTRRRDSETDERRQRPLAAPSLGMFMWLVQPPFVRSEAQRLLQLAREQARLPSATEADVLRLRELLQAARDAPLTGYAPHSASWLGLLGPGGMAAIAAVAAMA